MILDTFVYRCSESITIVNADFQRARILEGLNDPCVKRVVLDMESVKICDSSGIRMLLSIHRVTLEKNMALLLYKPDTYFSGMIASVKLDTIFTLVNDVEGLSL